MLGLLTTIVVICLIALFASLIGIIIFGAVSIAPILIETVIAYLAIRWLIMEFRDVNRR